jgi:DNA-binding beta-propeller fold protein YncE
VRVLVTPDGRTAVVANGGGSAVVLVETANPLATTVIPMSQAPKVLAVSGDGRRLYVSHPEPGGVSLIDLVARKLVKTVTLSGAPDGVAVVR